jgi:catechol 2,3-dioxygenase-like lactoylglutathione lyase family enzyme
VDEPKTYGLTHLAIAVEDIERTLHFYQQVFDMEIMYREESFLQLTTPGCMDVLVFEKKPVEKRGSSGGIAHFGFRLKRADDIEAVTSKVLAAGGFIIEKGEFVAGSPFIFFTDPDGYLVEVWYELI